MTAFIVLSGLPLNRRTALVWIVLGLAAGSIGRRGVGTVLLDFAPFFALLLSFGCFALFPAAPPWAAARCTAAELSGSPSSPPCMRQAPQVTHGGLIGRLHVVHPGAVPYVSRISARGLDVMHFHPGATLLDTGQATADLVAAVPSLHSAGVVLFVSFLWRRVRRSWRVLLALYPLAMGFVLVFTGEHYVTDVLLGWVLASAEQPALSSAR